MKSYPSWISPYQTTTSYKMILFTNRYTVVRWVVLSAPSLQFFAWKQLKNQLSSRSLPSQLLQKFGNAMLMTASSLLRKSPSQPSMTPLTRSTQRFLSLLKQRTMDRYPSRRPLYPERMVLSLLMFTENLLIRTGTWIFIHTTRRNTK